MRFSSYLMVALDAQWRERFSIIGIADVDIDARGEKTLCEILANDS
jgi:hypothetical protein